MKQQIKQAIVNLFLNYIVLSFIILLFIISIILIPNFAEINHLLTIIIQTADLAIVSFGLTFVILNGGIDFSIIGTICLGSVVGALLMNQTNGLLGNSHFGYLIAILIMVFIGIFIGYLNGVSVAYLKMPSFITTMGIYLITSGVAIFISNSESITNLPKQFINISTGSFLYVPIPILIMTVIFIVSHFTLSRTVFGRTIYAMGNNQKVAVLAGYNIKKNIIALFIISGFFAAISGIIITARIGAGSPIAARGMLLDIVAAVLIGGTSIAGGTGTILGTLAGALFITLLNNSLSMLGIQWYVINIIKGSILLIVALSDVIQIMNGNSKISRFISKIIRKS